MAIVKKWYYYPNHLLWSATLWLTFCGDALIDGRMFGFLVWSVIFLVVAIKWNHVFFPYFSSLHIGENEIERRILGIKYTIFPREKIFVVPIYINNAAFAVFTLEKIEHYSEWDVMKLAWKRKAIMYPVSPKMAMDFPEMFKWYTAASTR